MDVDAVASDAKSAKSTKSAGTTTTNDDDNDAKSKDEKMAIDDATSKTVTKKVDEPAFEVLANPSRVTLQQLMHVTFDVDERYVVL